MFFFIEKTQLYDKFLNNKQQILRRRRVERDLEPNLNNIKRWGDSPWNSTRNSTSWWINQSLLPLTCLLLHCLFPFQLESIYNTQCLRKIRVHHKFARNGREENVPESGDGERRRHWWRRCNLLPPSERICRNLAETNIN